MCMTFKDFLANNKIDKDYANIVLKGKKRQVCLFFVFFNRYVIIHRPNVSSQLWLVL